MNDIPDQIFDLTTMDGLQGWDPRQALEVTRYHTWQRIRDQSVGEHSAQVARILLAIWPNCPRHLIVHCVTHDLGEVGAGDPPYPVKRNNPDYRKAHRRVEYDVHMSMCLPWGVPPPVSLSTEERAVFKLAEFIEMWEWGVRETRMGNGYARLVAARCYAAARDLIRDPDVCPEVSLSADRYIRKRQRWESSN